MTEKKLEKAVLLDLDGTLVDSRMDLVTSVNLLRETYHLCPLDYTDIINNVGQGIYNLVSKCLPSAFNLDEAVTVMKKHYSKHLTDKTEVYPDVLQALEIIRNKGYKLAVVTNKPEIPAKTICDYYKLSPYLDMITGGDTCPNLKPHPQPLIHTLDALNCTSSGSWMVGDHFTDLQSGADAGMKCCFCEYGFGNPKGLTADISVSKLLEFAEYL